MTERQRANGGLAALAFWLVVTASWWVLALWPLADTAPDWIARTRAVCFNPGASGLPDASGWLLLIGQPIGMLGVLLVVWQEPVRAGLHRLNRARPGRALLAATLAIAVAGLGAAVTRVISASARGAPGLPADVRPPDTYPRLDRAAPRLGLLDQHGRRLDLVRLRGRPVLVAFAFGHCEAVCPTVVRQVLEARARWRARGGGSRPPRVVIVSLDPWRDTPSRLPYLARHWNLAGDDFVVSGEVAEVDTVLDAWSVPRRRDPKTGDVAHPPLVYVLDASGRIAYAASGDAPTLVELLDRL